MTAKGVRARVAAVVGLGAALLLAGPAPEVWAQAGGGPDAAAACGRSDLASEGMADLQRALDAPRGGAADPGPVDGVCGPRTVAAVAAYEAANGLEVTGVPRAALLARLRGAGGLATVPLPPPTVGTRTAIEAPARPSAAVDAESREIVPPLGAGPADDAVTPELSADTTLPSPAPPPSLLPETVDPVTGRPYLR